jgi:hypothetical protein
MGRQAFGAARQKIKEAEFYTMMAANQKAGKKREKRGNKSPSHYFSKKLFLRRFIA